MCEIIGIRGEPSLTRFDKEMRDGMNNVVAEELIGSLIGLIEDGQGSDYDGAFKYALERMKEDPEKKYSEGVDMGYKEGVKDTLSAVEDTSDIKKLYKLFNKCTESSCSDCVSRLDLIRKSRTLFIDGKEQQYVALEDVVSSDSVKYIPGQGIWIKKGDSLWQCSHCGEYSCCTGKFCPDCGYKMEKL